MDWTCGTPPDSKAYILYGGTPNLGMMFGLSGRGIMIIGTFVQELNEVGSYPYSVNASLALKDEILHPQFSRKK